MGKKAINWGKIATRVSTENVDNGLKLTNQSLTDDATISATTYQIGTTYTQNVYTYESGINMNIAAPSAKIVFGSDVQLTEGLTAEGAYYTDDVTVEGDVIVETRLTVDNQTILNNNLSVAGNTSLQDTTAKEIDCVTLDRTCSDADFLIPTTIGSASATGSTYESMPLIVDGTTKYRPGETNRQSLTFTHTVSDYMEGAKYASKFNEFDADISSYEIVPGIGLGFSETYTNYNILNTNGISNGYGATINCFDAAVRGKTTTQGGGAGAIFEVIANNDSAYSLPFNSAVKGVFSSAQNSGTGSTVGYFGYGYGTGSEGTAVGVCGYGTKSSTNVYTAGIGGVGYPSSLSNRNGSIIGTLGHIGVANGSLFSMNSTFGTNYIHPSAGQNTTTFPANELLHFDYTDGGCLHVSSTAEIIGPLFIEDSIHINPIADDDHVHNEGQLGYSSDTFSLNVDTDVEDVILQVGQENYIRVRNTSGATINNGDVVKVYDATGHTPEIELAAADDDCPCAVIGVATHSIANNGYGGVTTFGLVRDLNTTQQPGGTEGTILYLSTTPGELTDTQPAAPNHVTAIGIITYAHSSQGSILVRLGIGRPSTALSDFSRTTPSTDGYVPMGNNTGGYYEPSEITADDVDFSGRQINPSSIITGSITATSINTEGSNLNFAVTGDTKMHLNEDGLLYFDTPYGTDLRVPMTMTKLGGTKDPGFSLGRNDGSTSQGVFAYAFDNTQEEELYFSAQLPHSYKPGTDLEAHVHGGLKGAYSGNVVGGLEYTISSVGSDFGTTTTLTNTVASDRVAYRHQADAIGTIDGTGITESAMIIGRIFRKAGDAADTLSYDAFLFEIDFHYQSEKLGTGEEFPS